jgi:exonuclease III
MSPKEIQSFQFFANKSGFRLHYQLGDANLRPGRGSAVLVQKHLHLHAKFLKTWFEHDCQPVAVNVEGVNFVSNYVAVSGSAPDTSQEILLWLQESLGQKPWIIMGDWNQVPGECCMSQILVEEGAQLLAVKDTCSRLLPTRWLGRRAIDFGITNYQPKICGSGASVHGSDHW